MKIAALEGLTPTWFTPPDQDTDAPVRFRIRPLNGSEFGEVSDYLTLQSGRYYIKNAGRDVALNLALVDWENFNDSKGPVAFSREAIARIPYPVRVALVSQILELSSLPEEHAKN